MIRQASVKDAQALHTFMKEMYRDYPNFLVSDLTEFQWSVKDTERYLSSIQGIDKVYIYNDAPILGMLTFHQHKEKKYQHVATFGMSVKHGYESRGIGTQLIKQCIEDAKYTDLKKLEIEVFSNNIRAKQLYELFNFKEEGRKVKHANVYGTYVDVIQMSYFLKD